MGPRRAYHKAGIWYLQEGRHSGGIDITWTVLDQCPDSPEAADIIRGWNVSNKVIQANEPIPQAMRRHRPPA